MIPQKPNAISPIHPFPARMAPEIVFKEMKKLEPHSLIMDPMTGSGTVVRAASQTGHRAVAFDLDPLAVLMTKVWTAPINPTHLRNAGAKLISTAVNLKRRDISLPWIDSDQETLAFVDYWFGEEQAVDLRRISALLRDMSGTVSDALRIALSRIIVTKKRGASLAWDVSHSRPHRVKDQNDFSVIREFLRSVDFVATRLEKQPPPGGVSVKRGDARNLLEVRNCSVDAVITSPPYLNAIDYLRGHKLALIWFGYRIAELRTVRGNSIGSAKHNEFERTGLIEDIASSIPTLELLPRAERRMFERYVFDLAEMLSEIFRVLRPKGKAILVVGNSVLRGVPIDNAGTVSIIAKRLGFNAGKSSQRDLPTNRRYLPPPSDNDKSDLKKRMRTEVVLRYKKP